MDDSIESTDCHTIQETVFEDKETLAKHSCYPTIKM